MRMGLVFLLLLGAAIGLAVCVRSVPPAARTSAARPAPVAPAAPVTPLPSTPKASSQTTLQPTVVPMLPAAAEDPPAGAPPANGEPQWVVAYKDNFDDPKCVEHYYNKGNGELVWHEKYKAMMLHNKDAMGEVYAAVHQSLPGDLRVRFRALRKKSEADVSIGMMFSISGALRIEDGYFAEWARGIAQIKKHNQIRKVEQAPTPETADRWVKIELLKIGGHITMKMEDKVVLDWTDDEPCASQEHDLMSLYVWSESTLVDDFVVERNAHDKVKPMADDPAAEPNLLNSTRHSLDAPDNSTF